MSFFFKRAARYAALSGVLLAVLGSGLSSAANSAESAPVKGGTLVAVINPEPNQLNTSFNNQYANTVVSANIFDGLVTYDEQLQPKPALALSWEVAADGLSIKFSLRPGVRWHDGVAFTSADVRYSALELWKKTHARGRITFAPLVDVETPDALTAIFRLAYPAPVIMSALNTGESQILPKHLYENTDVRKNVYNTKPIGTGPFRFKEWRKGQFVELERNPDYWDKGKPYLDKLIFRTIPDAAGRGAALEAGEVQYVPYAGVPFSDVARLRKDPRFKFETRGYGYHSQVYYLEFNLRRQSLNNVKVRQAIAHAIDKQGLIDTVFYGIGAAAGSPVPASLGKLSNPDVPVYRYDPAAAERLLDEAGFPRAANGVRFALNLDVSPSSERFPYAAEYLRQGLKRVGIEVKTVLSDGPTYLRKIYTAYDFDFTIQPYSTLLDPEMGLTRTYWSKAASPGVPYVNASGYASKEADGLIESYQREANQRRRESLFKDFQRVAMTDLPLIPVMEAPFFTFYSSKLHGVNFQPDGVLSSFANAWLSR